ncbi:MULTISPECIES: hypothetical protein [unclassified Kitasatospora]
MTDPDVALEFKANRVELDGCGQGASAELIAGSVRSSRAKAAE